MFWKFQDKTGWTHCHGLLMGETDSKGWEKCTAENIFHSISQKARKTRKSKGPKSLWKACSNLVPTSKGLQLLLTASRRSNFNTELHLNNYYHAALVAFLDMPQPQCKQCLHCLQLQRAGFLPG